MKKMLLLAAMLSGCSLVHIEQMPTARQAAVKVAQGPDGGPEVVLYSIYSKHRTLLQGIRGATFFSLKSGTYIVNLDCRMPGGLLKVEDPFEFRITVLAGRSYTLGCNPIHSPPSNGFYLRGGT